MQKILYSFWVLVHPFTNHMRSVWYDDTFLMDSKWGTLNDDAIYTFRYHSIKFRRNRMSDRIELHCWLDTELSDKETRRTSSRHRDHCIIDAMPDEDTLFPIIILINSIRIDLIEKSSRKRDNPSDLLWWPPECVVCHDRSLTESKEKNILWRDIVLRPHFIDTGDDFSISRLEILSLVDRLPTREIDRIPCETILSEYEWSSEWYNYEVISKLLLQNKKISLIRSYPMEHNETLGSGGDMFRNMGEKVHWKWKKYWYYTGSWENFIFFRKVFTIDWTSDEIFFWNHFDISII